MRGPYVPATVPDKVGYCWPFVVLDLRGAVVLIIGPGRRQNGTRFKSNETANALATLSMKHVQLCEPCRGCIFLSFTVRGIIVSFNARSVA